MQRHTAFLVVLLLLLGFAKHCMGQTAGFRYYQDMAHPPTVPAIAAVTAVTVDDCAEECKRMCGCNGFNWLATSCVQIRRVVPLEPPPGFESTRPVAHKPNAGYRANNILAVRGKPFSSFSPLF